MEGYQTGRRPAFFELEPGEEGYEDQEWQTKGLLTPEQADAAQEAFDQDPGYAKYLADLALSDPSNSPSKSRKLSRIERRRRKQ